MYSPCIHHNVGPENATKTHSSSESARIGSPAHDIFQDSHLHRLPPNIPSILLEGLSNFVQFDAYILTATKASFRCRPPLGAESALGSRRNALSHATAWFMRLSPCCFASPMWQQNHSITRRRCCGLQNLQQKGRKSRKKNPCK